MFLLPWDQKSGVNLSGHINPLGDSLALLTPEGIGNALNPFVSIAVRDALGSGDAGYADSLRMNSFGGTEPDTNVGGEVLSTFTQTPLLDTANTYGGGGTKGPGQRTVQFLGLPYNTESDISRAVERTRKARVALGLEKGEGNAKAKQAAALKALRSGLGLRSTTGLATIIGRTSTSRTGRAPRVPRAPRTPRGGAPLR
jgi:hypothetical protein